MQHQPVLLTEVIIGLAIQPDGIYVDATFGRGGHSRAILKQLGPSGRLLVLDKDPAAIAVARGTPEFQDPRFSYVHDSFVGLGEAVRDRGWQGAVSGILLDVGVSSPQIDDPERGFSFVKDGPLDMRMDPQQGIKASEWLKTVDETTLADVLFDYGEERYSRRIARAIVGARVITPLTRTTQLSDIIAKAHPKWEKGQHPATRSFQAIRIFINQELASLQKVLPQCVTALKAGGRLCVIAFHSLEDRIVKQFMAGKTAHEQAQAMQTRRLPALPTQMPVLRRVGKVIFPTSEEVAANPRARSARLRVAEKCD